eukprot:GGOE01005633.1.p1 GENE.GGOE01005633.1~~GGOE01005633.1.p1  ORF type:complete len:565 (+),score=153.31 GGOE01005633.1:725-2419(+)
MMAYDFSKVYQQMLDVISGWDDLKATDHTLAAYLGLGCVYSAMEQYSNALASFDNAFMFAPMSENPTVEIRISLFRGNAHFSLQSPEKAWEHYERALRLARKHQEPRHQLRALCGEMHCYYDDANYQDAAKLLKKALAVPQPESTALPTTLDQLLDEQLLQMLHWTLQHHVSEALGSELTSTLYVYLWGMATVLIRNVGVLAPASLPPNFLDTVRAALLDACRPQANGKSSMCAPYVQHYGLAILHHVSSQKGLRAALHSAKTADAVLACLASQPHIPPSSGVPLEVHAAAAKLLKVLVMSLPPGAPRQDVAGHFWKSSWLRDVNALLLRLPEPLDETQEQHMFHVMTALCVLLEGCRPPTGTEGSTSLPPSNASEMMSTFLAVCEMVKGRIDHPSSNEPHGHPLALGCRFLLHCSKRLPSARAMLRRRLDPVHLEHLSGHGAMTRRPSSLVTDVCRVLRRPQAEEHQRVVDFRSIPGVTGPLTDESTSWEDSTALDSLDSTAFDSVSSDSSTVHTPGCHVIVVEPLPLTLDDFDSELVTSSSADVGSIALCDTDRSDRLASIG